jgi:hypothetical protein
MHVCPEMPMKRDPDVILIDSGTRLAKRAVLKFLCRGGSLGLHSHSDRDLSWQTWFVRGLMGKLINQVICQVNEEVEGWA